MSRGKAIIVTEKILVEETKEFNFIWSKYLQENINKVKAVQKLTPEKEPGFLFQEEYAVLNICPWDFYQGDLFCIPNEEGMPTSGKVMEIADSSELSDQIKRNFYTYFMLVLSFGMITVAGGILYTNCKATSFLFLLPSSILASALAVTAHCSFDLMTLLMVSFLAFIAIGVMVTGLIDKVIIMIVAIIIVSMITLLLFAGIGSIGVFAKIGGGGIIMSETVISKIFIAYIGAYALEFIGIHDLAKKQKKKKED